jgi:hypothetical protein
MKKNSEEYYSWKLEMNDKDTQERFDCQLQDS